MKKLSKSEVKKLINKEGIQKEIAEKFLMDMGMDLEKTIKDLECLASLEGWNNKTYYAVRKGIFLAQNKGETNE